MKDGIFKTVPVSEVRWAHCPGCACPARAPKGHLAEGERCLLAPGHKTDHQTFKTLPDNSRPLFWWPLAENLN